MGSKNDRLASMKKDRSSKSSVQDRGAKNDRLASMKSKKKQKVVKIFCPGQARSQTQDVGGLRKLGWVQKFDIFLSRNSFFGGRLCLEQKILKTFLIF